MNLREVWQREGLFLPLVFRWAAEIEKFSWEEFITDPTNISFAIGNAFKRVQYDGVINCGDAALEAEGLGCNVTRSQNGEIKAVTPPEKPHHDDAWMSKGNLPSVIQSTERLCIELKKRVPVVGVITGPLTLITFLSTEISNFEQTSIRSMNPPGRDLIELISGVISRETKTYCQMGLGAILIAESTFVSMNPVNGAIQRNLLETSLNVAEYYQIPVVLSYNPQPGNDGQNLLTESRVDFVLSPFAADRGVGDIERWITPLPESFFQDQRLEQEKLETLRRLITLPEYRRISTMGEVKQSTPVALMQVITNEIKKKEGEERFSQ